MTQRILIIRLSAIGDVIHTLPALEVLRTALPKARIGWVVEELSAPLLEGHQAIDRLYVMPKRRWRGQWAKVWRSEVVPFFRGIRQDGWDATIDFQGLTKSGVVALAAGAKVRIGYGDRDGREINKWFTNRKIVPPESARHVVERNLCLLEGLGISVPRERVFGGIALEGEEKTAAREFFEAWGMEPGREVVALNPGAGWESKRWPWGHFVRVGERLYSDRNLKPLVLWGPNEEALRDAILGDLRERGVEARAAPPTGLRELAALVREVALFVGGDTGPTHLAAIQGVPTLGVFGGSDAVRNGPWGPRVHTLQTTTLPCVPCWKQKCLLPRGNSEVIPCLERVTPEQVAEMGLALLGEGPRGNREGR